MIGSVIDNQYKIIARLGEGGMSVVYRALDMKSNTQIAIKFLKRDITSSYIRDVVRFQKEVHTLAGLEHPGIVRVYGTGDFQGVPYLVMELLSGCNLRDMIKIGRRFDVNDGIKIIKQIAEILCYIHDKGLIHRDLKPGNIMVIEEDHDFNIKVLDFGLALVMNLNQIKEENEIVGTFSYMSPEATGIVNKPVDERSDLYSLGIVFYQIMTGILPFKGNSISSIIYQHIARVPVIPSKLSPQIPKVVEEMILKLLQKDPTERYQTARGLIADLERFQKGESGFALGEEDRLKRLIYRTRFIDREEESKNLQSLFKRAMQGNGQVCFIKGEAGSGKSRLVNELRTACYEANAMFLETRCLKQENKPIYQPFRDILNEYIKQVKELSESSRKEIEIRLKEKAGKSGKIIEAVAPAIKELIGESPQLVEIEPEREQKRFLDGVSNFLCSFSTKYRPVVFYLDDLQWIDKGSVKVISELISVVKNSYLFIIGGYRAEEVSDTHYLLTFKEQAQRKGYPLGEIALYPFNLNRTREMISQLLGESEEAQTVQNISEYIQNKSRGNPFFIIEIARNLVDEGVLFSEDGNWKINEQKQKEISLPVSVVDVLLKRIETLDKEERDLMSYGAVLGREIDLDILFSVSKYPWVNLMDIIDRGVKLQFLEWKSGEKVKPMFIHDHVREAFLVQLGREKVKQIHLETGRILEDLNRENLSSVIFDLAHHFYEGGDIEKTLEYAVPAGKKAKESYANAEAERYFKAAISILKDKGQTGGPLWVECTEALGDVYLSTGKYNEGIEIFRDLLNYKKGPVERAEAYRKICIAYYKKGDLENSEESGKLGLSLLGEKFPKGNFGLRLFLIKELFAHFYRCMLPLKRRLRKINAQNEKMRARIRAIIHIYQPLLWTLILTDLNKCLTLIIRALNICERKLGKSLELGSALASYAGTCMSIPLFNRAVKYHKIALALRRELNDEKGIAQSLHWLGYCYAWSGRCGEGNKYSFEAMELYQKIGDLWELGMVKNSIAFNYYYDGDFGNAIKYFQEHMELSVRTEDCYGTCISQAPLSWCYLRMGDLEKAEEISAQALDLSEKEKQWFLRCGALAYHGEIKMEQGKISDAIRYMEEARELDKKNRFIKHYTVTLYNKLAEAYYMMYAKEGTKENLRKFREACAEALKETSHWPNRYCSALRVKAKEQTLLGKKRKARKYFLKSIAQSQKYRRGYELAKSMYEYGKWLNEINRKKEAIGELQKAYELFKNVKAKLYMKRTANLLGIKEEESTPQERLSVERDLASLMESSQFISSILDLDDLLDKIMDSAMEVTGAERGLLLLYPEEEKKGCDLEVVVSRNVEEKEIETNSIQISWAIVNKVARKKEPLIVVDAASDSELKTHESVIVYGLKSILCAPLINRGALLGVIYLDNRLVSGLFEKRDLEVLNTLSTQAAISIQNARLYKKAIIDGLTGVYNHVYFQQYLEEEVNKAQKEKAPLSVLMIDIDFFKKINDENGHQIGDAILKGIADLLKQEVGKKGLAARYGGEEFAIVLPSADLDAGKSFGENLRQKVAKNKISCEGGKQLPVTVSIGVAVLEKGMDRLSLVEHADRALYKAKSLGRNRTVSSSV